MPRKRHPPVEQPALKAAAAWFAFTPRERWFAAVVLAIFLVGLAARRAHLRRLADDPVPPPDGESTGHGERLP